MTTVEIITVVIGIATLAIAVASVLYADGRSRARNDATAERVAKLEGLMDRVTVLEADARNGTAMMQRHFVDDMAALARLDVTIREGRAEMLEAFADLRADVRERMGREDTNPRR